jgi:hypothetical protein
VAQPFPALGKTILDRSALAFYPARNLFGEEMVDPPPAPDLVKIPRVALQRVRA